MSRVGPEAGEEAACSRPPVPLSQWVRIGTAGRLLGRRGRLEEARVPGGRSPEDPATLMTPARCGVRLTMGLP